MKHLVSLAIFIALALFAWSSITKYYSDEQQLQDKTKRYVEVFITEFEMTSMNDSGKPV